jgi:hypothetical protein
MWTNPQRAVVVVMVLGIFVYLSVRLSFSRTRIGEPQPPEGLRAGDLAVRFDPNTATQPEWAAMPGIGDKLATSITDFRDRYVVAHPGRFAFVHPEDLLQIRGVGQAKLETLRAHLLFPATQP